MSRMVVGAIVSAVADAVEAAGVKPVYERRISALDDGEGAVVRVGPQGTVRQYINGQADVSQRIRVMVRRRSATAAMSDAERAWDAMDGLTVTAGGVTASLSAYGTPTELTLEDSGHSVWEADATATYTTPKQGE